MKSFFILACCACVLLGCSHIVWEKPGMTQEVFLKDRYECRRDSRGSLVVAGYNGGMMMMNHVQTENLFEMCMEAKGYTMKRVRDVQEIPNQPEK